MKPTYGRVSRYGVMPLAESLDHIGPMTRSVRDAAAVFQAIAGRDVNDPTSLSDEVPNILSRLDGDISSLRIGVDESFLRLGSPEGLVMAIQKVINTLQSIGATLVEVKMPGEFSQQLRDTWVTICSYEAHKAHAATYPSRANEYGEYFREFLHSGSEVSDSDYNAAGRERRRLNRIFENELSKVDAVVCPSGGVPFEIAPGAQYGGMDAISPVLSSMLPHNSMPADFAGTPTLTLPCGFSDEGVPYSVQLMGPRLGEEGICRLGYAYEQTMDWQTRHPAV
jgi:amidase